MNIKKQNEKAYLLAFIFSLFCILFAAILKILGINIFTLNFNYQTFSSKVEILIKTILLLIQYYLIVGCVTNYSPKKLFIKMLPYFPLTTFLFFIPDANYLFLSGLILFITCFSIYPKFSTIIKFSFNITFICCMQVILIWLKTSIVPILPLFPNALQLLIMNIDQYIILVLLYYFNMKWGDIYGLAIFRRKEKTHFFR